MTKNEIIKQSLKETSEKRKNQICKTYKVKFDKSHLSKEKIKYLNALFLEAKWIYNFCLSQEDIFKVSDKIKEVEILNKNKEKELRKISCLSSQMKQAVVDKCKQNIFNLSKAKKRGIAVGRLKFKSEYNCIPLKQYEVTYKIRNKKYIKIQGFKKDFKINGLNQITDCDIANANLLKENGDYYLSITTYKEKQNKIIPEESIGIDFGISDDFVFSNGVKVNTKFDYDKVKNEHKKLSKKTKGSKNQYKQKLKLKKAYKKISNQKQDVKNKVVSFLKNNYNTIAIQDEQIKNWHKGLFGKAVQSSILGITLSELKKHDRTKIVDRWFPTTKMCYNCGKLNKIKLSERTYNCTCGLTEDRDVKSAKTILRVAMEHSNFKPAEKETSGKMLNYFNTFLSYTSVKQEAQTL